MLVIVVPGIVVVIIYTVDCIFVVIACSQICCHEGNIFCVLHLLNFTGTLQFRTLPSPSVLSRGDDTYGVVYANSKFVIGNNFFDNFYVSSHCIYNKCTM